jgi:hypothetical protein
MVRVDLCSPESNCRLRRRTYVTQRDIHGLACVGRLSVRPQVAFKSEAITTLNFLRGIMYDQSIFCASLGECHRSRAWHDECKKETRTMRIYTTDAPMWLYFNTTYASCDNEDDCDRTREGTQEATAILCILAVLFCCMLFVAGLQKAYRRDRERRTNPN